MKVFHINEVVYGGVGRTVTDLHLALRKLGVESVLLSPADTGQVPYCESYEIPKEKYQAVNTANFLLYHNQTTPRSRSIYFTLDFLGSDIIDHPCLRDADVIHLQWSGNFLSSPTIAKLATLNKPIIWTLHTMNPLTGGCHYSIDCNRFVENCGECPLLKNEPFNFTARTLEAKRLATAAINPVFVVPSQWMLQQAKKSSVAKEVSVCCIPNGVDCNLFHPADKRLCREALNLNPDVWYILVAAATLIDYRKGVDHMITILENLRHYPPLAEAIASGKLRLLCCGTQADLFKPKGWQADTVGFVSPEKMPLVFNSANLFLFPSIAESFGNVVIESMACGTPVLAHRIGGPADIFSDELLSTCLVDVGDTLGWVASIVRLFLNPSLYTKLSTRFLEIARQFYSIENHAAAHLELYTAQIAAWKSQARNAVNVPDLASIREGAAEAVLFALEKTQTEIDTAEAQIRIAKTQLQLFRSDLENVKIQMKS